MTNTTNCVLLLGGTGPMGVHLTRILASNGYHVVVTSRKEHNSNGQVQYLRGNAKELDFLKSVLSQRRWLCVVDFMTYKTVEFKERICLLLESTQHYIFLSSSRVYASVNPISEDSPRLLDTSEDIKYLETDEYALYKAREEDILLKSKYLNYTIVRPYITFAENRLPLGVLEKETWIRRVLQGKDIAIPQDVLEKYTTLSYGEDVSLYIAELVNNPKCLGRIINITSGIAMKWKTVLDIYLDVIQEKTGRRPKVYTYGRACYSCRNVVKMLLKDIFSLGTKKFSRMDYSINYQLEYDRMFDRIFDNTQSDTICKINYKDINKTLSESTRYFIDHPIYNYINWRTEFVHDLICGNTTPLSQIPTLKLKFQYFLIRFILPRKYLITD